MSARYLDCGCYLDDAGKRSWCPTCLSAPQKAPDNTGAPIVPLVIADLEARREFGRKKYGDELRLHNGRDSLIDAYQEALDLVIYLRQLIEQQAHT